MRSQQRFREVLMLLAALIVVVFSVVTVLEVNDRNRVDVSPGENADFNQRVEDQERQREQERMEEATLTVERPTGRPLRVQFVGDSLMAGYYATTLEKSFRLRLIKYLEASGPVRPLLATKAPQEELFQIGNTDLVSSGDDLVVLELGTNDAGRTPLGAFERQYRAMLNRIEKQSPDAGILCAGVWGEPLGGDRSRVRLDLIIADLCETAGGQYVALSELYQDQNHGPKGRQTWAGPSDDFHPNDRGHRLIAERLMEHLRIV